MKYFSAFSGIGGFELGIMQSNVYQPECVGFSEIDKYAISIYKKHFNHKNYGDISKINPKDLPDFSLFVGGFPCQAFSIAGKRRGFHDTRGTLFFEIIRIVKEKRPRLLLLENVKGLLSHAKGDTFRVILSSLDELGYDIDWQVLNSKNFGLPQHRERVFIIGHLRGTGRPKVFPFGEAQEDTNKEHRKVICKSQIAQTITSTYYKGAKGSHIEKDGKIRRLTPLECERLQGFPDNWTKDGVTPCAECEEWGCQFSPDREVFISDTQRYKCLGNAVSVPVIKSIMNRLIIKEV